MGKQKAVFDARNPVVRERERAREESLDALSAGLDRARARQDSCMFSISSLSPADAARAPRRDLGGLCALVCPGTLARPRLICPPEFPTPLLS